MRGLRVEAAGRFVENGDARLFHEDFGDAETLPHAVRIGADGTASRVLQPHPFERRFDAPIDLGGGMPASRAV